MIAWFLAMCVSASLLSPNCLPGAESQDGASERRMFAVRSQEAWKVVAQRLTQLGFVPDKTDRSNQAVLTKWRAVGDKGLEWLPAALPVDPHVPRRMRFLVFVSPFVEPARLAVASILETSNPGNPRSVGVGYNVSSFNRALMGELARALGQEGRPIAEAWGERSQTALDLLKDGNADPCLRTPPLRPSTQDKITPPRIIPLSKFEPVYPAEAETSGEQGTVRVEFTIQEDGTATGVQVLNSTDGSPLNVSAAGVTSLLLFTPARIKDCPVPAVSTHDVRYQLR